MPKLKSNSGAKKRFRVSANGVIMHSRSNKNHGMVKWGAKRNLQLRASGPINADNDKRVRRYLLSGLSNSTHRLNLQ